MGRARGAAKTTEPPVDIRTGSERRDEIVRVASALLREKGIGISLQDIADELGVTYNALYHHFKSRDDLIFRCLSRGAALMHDVLLERAATSDSGLEKVLGFVHDFWATAVREKTPPGLLFATLSIEAQQALGEQGEPSHALLLALINEGVADGSIVVSEPLVSTAMILHTIYWWPHELDGALKIERVEAGVMEHLRRALSGLS